MSRLRIFPLILTVTLALIVGVPVSSSADTLNQNSTIVGEVPTTTTPSIQDGTAWTVTKVGDTVIVGGDFSTVTDPGSSTSITRNDIVAFNASTGEVSTTFVPQLDGTVYDLLPAPGGTSVYVAGSFSSVNGVRMPKIVELDVATGAIVQAFDPPTPSAMVRHLALSGGRLYIGGTFAKIGGTPRTALAALDPTTGALDDYLDLTFAGTHQGGVTKVMNLAVNPQGTKLVATGNFQTVDGYQRQQFVMIDLGANRASVDADYATTRWNPTCTPSVDTYMRGLAWATDGSYFIISATGAGYTTGSLCDTVTRWDPDATGTDIQPTWVSYMGGDSVMTVSVTDKVIYIGGHERWANDTCPDRACQGAVSRQGIGALDPVNGMPYSWNPTRTRGHGVEDLGLTADGLYVASDTDVFNQRHRGRIAFLPLADGETIPDWNAGSLPGQVYTADDSGVTRRSFDGTAAAAPVTAPGGGIDWSQVRGAFMLNGYLYYGTSDGSFYKRSFDGTDYGPATAIDAADQLVYMSSWHGEVRDITGMFYADGRLYYTNGDGVLHFRYFEPESDIVGTQQFTATDDTSGVDWRRVDGMFAAGGKLYYADSRDGELRSVAFGREHVSGTATVLDGGDWRGRASFLYAGKPDVPPVASYATACADLTCQFDGTGSHDPDGTVADYSWDFGDGHTAAGATVSHTFAAAGTYSVKLTVTDDRGGTDSTTRQVTVAASPIGFVGTDDFNDNSNSPHVTVPSGVQPGDGLLLTMSFNNTAADVTDPPGWTLVNSTAGSNITSRVYERVATAGDASSSVTVGLSRYSKVDLRVTAYQGTDTSAPVATAKHVITTSGATRTTPTATADTSGSWVVGYWAAKGSATSWGTPSSGTSRGASSGPGAAHVTAMLADSDGGVSTGTVGGWSADIDAAGDNAAAWTIVLAPRT